MDTATVDRLVEQYTHLTDAIATLTAQLDQVKGQMRGLGAGHHTSSHGLTVTVTPQRRFNAARAATELPADLVQACQDFSATKARKVLPPALYESLMDEAGDPRIVVR